MLDAADSYGTSWASLSGADFVHAIINRGLAAADVHSQQAQQTCSSPTNTAADDSACTSRNSVSIRQQQQQLEGVHGCSLYTHPKLEEALADKSLIVDLAPRVGVDAMFLSVFFMHLHVGCMWAHEQLEHTHGCDCLTRVCFHTRVSARSCTRTSPLCSCWCPARHTTTLSSNWLRASKSGWCAMDLSGLVGLLAARLWQPGICCAAR